MLGYLSGDKFPSTFAGQMEITVFTAIQIFIATPAIVKNGEYQADIPQL